jgi:hypothetical protein
MSWRKLKEGAEHRRDSACRTNCVTHETGHEAGPDPGSPGYLRPRINPSFWMLGFLLDGGQQPLSMLMSHESPDFARFHRRFFTPLDEIS